MTPGQGYAEPGWEDVAAAVGRDESGTELGGFSLAVRHRGELVVDVWGGADPVSGRPWEQDSVTTIFSCTKAVTSVVMLRLVDQGLLELDAPVARYWPEFAAAGKSAITVRQVMSHVAGLTFVGTQDLAVLYAPEAVAIRLAAATPLHRAGRHWIYHALTVGYLCGEIARRVTGASIGDLLRQQVCGPRGLDLWIGLPESEDHRFRPSHLLAPPDLSMVEVTWDEPLVAAAAQTSREVLGLFVPGYAPGAPDNRAPMQTRAFRATEMPAANGIANARGLADLYAALIDKDDPLVTPRLLADARVCRTDDALPTPYDPLVHRYGTGVDLANPNNPMLGDGCFGHTGAGGRVGFAWPEQELSLGYVSTTMGAGEPDPRWAPVYAAVGDAVRQVSP